MVFHRKTDPEIRAYCIYVFSDNPSEESDYQELVEKYGISQSTLCRISKGQKFFRKLLIVDPVGGRVN